MSWLSNATGIHINLKPAAPVIGGLIGSLIPGVGTAAGAGLGRTLSGIGNGESIGKAALGGVTAGAGAAALGAVSDRARALLGSLGLPGGTPGGAGTIADASTGGMPGEGGGILDNIKAELGRVVGRVANGQSPISLGTAVSANGGGTSGGTGGAGTSLLDKLLMGGTVAAGAADAVQKHNLQNKAQDYSTQTYDAKAPLRARALALLVNDPKPDPQLAAISTDPGNVYDRARRARMLAASATSPSAPTA